MLSNEGERGKLRLKDAIEILDGSESNEGGRAK